MRLCVVFRISAVSKRRVGNFVRCYATVFWTDITVFRQRISVSVWRWKKREATTQVQCMVLVL